MLAKLSVLALCCAGTVAQAADNGLYLGLGAARSDFDAKPALDSKDEGLKLIAGFRLLDSFGVELTHIDHGKATLPSGIACVALVGTNCPDQSELSAKTTTAWGVGFIDFPLLDLFGKVGLSHSDSKLATPGVSGFGDSDKDTKFAWGVGAQAHFLSFAARAEYEQFKVLGDRKLNVVSVSLLYTFL